MDINQHKSGVSDNRITSATTEINYGESCTLKSGNFCFGDQKNFSKDY